MTRVIDVIVFINEIKEIKSKNNEKMCFVKLSDDFSNIDGVIFNNAYSEIPDIKVNDIVKIRGKIESRKGKPQIIVNKLELLD